MRGRGGKTMLQAVVKVKIGELEEGIRAGSLRMTRKELTGLVQGFS